MKKQTKQQTINNSQGLMQMYQAGYLDCWKKLKKDQMRSKKSWKEYNLACMNSFEKRFIKKINKIIKKKGGLKHGKSRFQRRVPKFRQRQRK